MTILAIIVSFFFMAVVGCVTSPSATAASDIFLVAPGIEMVIPEKGSAKVTKIKTGKATGNKYSVRIELEFNLGFPRGKQRLYFRSWYLVKPKSNAEYEAKKKVFMEKTYARNKKKRITYPYKVISSKMFDVGNAKVECCLYDINNGHKRYVAYITVENKKGRRMMLILHTYKKSVWNFGSKLKDLIGFNSS